MVSKGNLKQPGTISPEDLKQLFTSAFDAFSRTKESAAEAAAFAYIAYRETQFGDPKKWLDSTIKAYEDEIDEYNKKINNRFERAKNFMEGKLSPDDHLNQKTDDEAKAKEHDEERELLRADHKMPPLERRKLRRVSLKPRENTNRFATIVRCSLKFFYEHQAAITSRYCLALEWIDAEFSITTNLTVQMIKIAFAKAEGFEKAIHDQAKKMGGSADTDSDKIIVLAVNKAAREKVKAASSKGSLQVDVKNSKDGFVLLLARTDGANVEVIGEADLTAGDIDRAVNNLGSKAKLDCNPACEFVGRVLDIGKLIPEGVEIPRDNGKGDKITSQRVFTMAPGPDGEMDMIVSANRVDVSSVLHARPRDTGIMALQSGAAAYLLSDERQKLEWQIKNESRRALVTITPSLNPTTAANTPAKSLLSWDCENSALVAAKYQKPVTKVYWASMSKLGARPLDVSGFRPECTGSIDAVDMQNILNMLPKPKPPSKGKTQQAEVGEDGEAASTDKKDRTVKTVNLKIADNMLRVTCGDADPLDIKFENDSRAVINVRLRVQDAYGLLTYLRNIDCQIVKLVIDGGGLVQFVWEDAFGFYTFSQPTCGSDGKLNPRRVEPIRVELPAIAAE